MKIDRYDNFSSPEDSNDLFLYSNAEDLLNDTKTLGQMINKFFSSQVDRLKKLEHYSNGKNVTIGLGDRRLEKDKADNRISHNYGGFISSFVTGYIMGQPVTASYGEDIDDEVLDDIEDYNDLNSLNYELAYDASRYGRAFEYHYRDQNEKDRIVLIDPKDMFTVRSDDVENNLIMAIHCPVINDLVQMTVYTDTNIIKFEPFKLGVPSLKQVEVKPHRYGMVPVVEWYNNRYRSGDFESVISIIDAYDAAQSDTANYMSDLNDALLVVKVDNLDRLGGDNGVKKMSDANIMVIENGVNSQGNTVSGDAHYIYKQYDVAGSEAYKSRLVKDIFKLSNVPDITDEKFGTQSGIAIQYKLIGLKQIQVTKENYFSKALARRYKLLENIHKSLGLEQIMAESLDFTFHPNLPQDVWEEVDNYISSGGKLSQETLRELASFTNNSDETERILKESQEAMKEYLIDGETI